MANGEVACFEQFILLPQCFQKSSAAEASESIYIRERVKTSTVMGYSCFSDGYQMSRNEKFEHSCPRNSDTLGKMRI